MVSSSHASAARLRLQRSASARPLLEVAAAAAMMTPRYSASHFCCQWCNSPDQCTVWLAFACICLLLPVQAQLNRCSMGVIRSRVQWCLFSHAVALSAVVLPLLVLLGFPVIAGATAADLPLDPSESLQVPRHVHVGSYHNLHEGVARPSRRWLPDTRASSEVVTFPSFATADATVQGNPPFALVVIAYTVVGGSALLLFIVRKCSRAPKADTKTAKRAVKMIGYFFTLLVSLVAMSLKLHTLQKDPRAFFKIQYDAAAGKPVFVGPSFNLSRDALSCGFSRNVSFTTPAENVSCVPELGGFALMMPAQQYGGDMIAGEWRSRGYPTSRA